MRVIAGTCRGRKLSAPAGLRTRPTADRVKEALFSILSSRMDFADIRVLDICAGTGSLGIEALSRGAASCCFIESTTAVKAILEKNISMTGFQQRSLIMTMDAVKALSTLASRGQGYELVFFDPPYDSELYLRVPDLLGDSCLVSSGAVFVAECSVRTHLSESYGRLKRFDRREYGETALELFTVEE